MRVSMVASLVGIATASVAFAQTKLVREPRARASFEVAEPDQAPASDAAGSVMPGTNRYPKATEQTHAWPSWQEVEVVDPWREPSESSSPEAPAPKAAELDGSPSVASFPDAPAAAEVSVPRSWARVLREPMPHFSSLDSEPTAPTSAGWAEPVPEIVNPWQTERASWVPVSEVIVDPWQDR